MMIITKNVLKALIKEQINEEAPVATSDSGDSAKLDGTWSESDDEDEDEARKRAFSDLVNSTGVQALALHGDFGIIPTEVDPYMAQKAKFAKGQKEKAEKKTRAAAGIAKYREAVGRPGDGSWKSKAMALTASDLSKYVNLLDSYAKTVPRGAGEGARKQTDAQIRHEIARLLRYGSEKPDLEENPKYAYVLASMALKQMDLALRKIPRNSAHLSGWQKEYTGFKTRVKELQYKASMQLQKEKTQVATPVPPAEDE